MEYKAHGPGRAPIMFELGCRKVTLKKREKQKGENKSEAGIIKEDESKRIASQILPNKYCSRANIFFFLCKIPLSK